MGKLGVASSVTPNGNVNTYICNLLNEKFYMCIHGWVSSACGGGSDSLFDQREKSFVLLKFSFLIAF